MDVLAEADAAEHADEVVVDGGVVVRCDGAEEIDYIMLGVAGDVGVAEEDYDVAGRFALNVHAAKEADCVVNCGVWGDFDVGEELDSILLCSGVG